MFWIPSRPKAAPRSPRPKARSSATPTASRCRKEGVATSAAEAAKLAAGIGFPVVLKIVSPEILHKTEAGGVLVGVKSAEEVRAGLRHRSSPTRRSTTRRRASLGVQVQQMLAGGQEVIIGAVTDPSFGKLVAFGLGGVLVEVLKDITFRLAPATQDDALSMLDGIAAARDPQGRARRGCRSTATRSPTMIENVSQLVADFPEIAEMDLNPVFATDEGAIAADVRIVVDFSPRAGALPAEARGHRARHEPHHEAGGGRRDRRLGRGRQDRQLGDEEPDQRRLPGRRSTRSTRPPTRSWAARRTRASRTFPATSTSRCSRSRPSSSRRRSPRCGEKKIPGAVLIPSGFAETGNVAGQQEIVDVGRKYGVRLMGPNIYGFYYTSKQPLRDVLHGVRRQGQRRAVVAVGRHRHGDHRLLALGEDGRLGDRRPGQQVGHRRGRSADVLRAGRQHADHRAALRGPEGRPRLRRGGQARVEEEAGRRAQGRTHRHGRARGQLAHRRARRQRQDLRRRAPAVGRDSRALAARHARVRARASHPADAQGRQHRHHHRRRRLGRAAVRRGASTTGCR